MEMLSAAVTVVGREPGAAVAGPHPDTPTMDASSDTTAQQHREGQGLPGSKSTRSGVATMAGTRCRHRHAAGTGTV